MAQIKRMQGLTFAQWDALARRGEAKKMTREEWDALESRQWPTSGPVGRVPKYKTDAEKTIKPGRDFAEWERFWRLNEEHIKELEKAKK
jgi:hypothetical protein